MGDDIHLCQRCIIPTEVAELIEERGVEIGGLIGRAVERPGGAGGLATAGHGGVVKDDAAGFDVLDACLIRQLPGPDLVDGLGGEHDAAVVVLIAVLGSLAVCEGILSAFLWADLGLVGLRAAFGDVTKIAAKQEIEANEEEGTNAAAGSDHAAAAPAAGACSLAIKVGARFESHGPDFAICGR